MQLNKARERWLAQFCFSRFFRFGVLRYGLQSKIESRPLPRRGLHPNAAAVRLHDFLGDGKANAGAWVFFTRVQALKNLEDASEMLRIDPDAVVLDDKLPGVVLARSAQFDLQWPAAFELQGIPQQVLEKERKLPGIPHDQWQRPMLNIGAACLDRCSQIVQDMNQHVLAIDALHHFGF